METLPMVGAGPHADRPETRVLTTETPEADRDHVGVGVAEAACAEEPWGRAAG